MSAELFPMIEDTPDKWGVRGVVPGRFVRVVLELWRRDESLPEWDCRRGINERILKAAQDAGGKR